MRSSTKLLIVLSLLATATISPLSQTPSPAATPVAVSIDAKIFDAYTGQYADPVNIPGTVLSFFREGEHFYIRVTNQDKIEIFPMSETHFFLKAPPAQVEFVRENGKVASIKYRQGGQDTPLKRTSDTPEADTRIPYKRSEAMIPMRDGVKLYTVILTPEKQIEPAAILMDRTPYGVKGTTPNRASSRPELAKDGYVFVFQDIRGRYDSEGQFLMNRPPRDKHDAKSVDESTDTYDTIDWLVKNIPNNNGRVGIYGVSYDGWLAAAALIDAHPALKASSPQAPMTDAWMGDDFFHNGAFRMSYGHEYAKWMEYGKPDADPPSFDIDAYDWYLNMGLLSKLAATLENKSPTFNSFVAHPAYDSYWQARSSARYLPCTNVPTLVVGGWWDQEDEYGALAAYRALEKCDKNNNVFFVMGPWNHGGWGGRGRRLGAIDFGSETGTFFKQQIQAPFFACQLKNRCEKPTPEASIFQSGSNRWMTYDAWPPRQLQPRELYFHADGKLSFDKPAGEKSEFDSYISDPADPVPYRQRPIQGTYANGSTWYTWLVSDQRFLADRKDVLKLQTDVLTDDVTISGDVIAHLFASTTGSDSDWVVKLIDVYPDAYPDPKMAGYQLMVADEIFRGRYRKSYEKPEAIKPNKVLDYTIDLRGNDHVFKKGHRIMIEVQSTWFPLYDRNPQTFVNSIFAAKPEDYKPATQRIWRSSKYPSNVSVTVAPAGN